MKAKIVIIISIILLTTSATSINAYADTSYESKFWAVTNNQTYIRYGHFVLNSDKEFCVVMCLFDNGSTKLYRPLIYSDEPCNITLTVLGTHEQGTSIEEAKNLTDYYNEVVTLEYIQLTDENNEPVYIFYNSWLESSQFMEYYSYPDIYEFLTDDSPKFYYYEENASLLTQQTFVNAFQHYLDNTVCDFTISQGNLVLEKNSNSSLEFVNVIECSSVIIQMLYKIIELCLQKPFVYFVAIAIIFSSIGVFACARKNI